jgi:hypothetical protein
MEDERCESSKEWYLKTLTSLEIHAPKHSPTGNLTTLIISPAPEVIPAATPARARKVRTLGTSFIDGQGTALEGLSIQARDCLLKVLAIAELDKAETSGRPCHLVANHHSRGHLKARIGYEFAERRIGRAMG